MSRHRFQGLIRVLQFDNAEKRAHGSPDSPQPITSLFEKWNDSLLDRFVSRCDLTVNQGITRKILLIMC